ncbi:DUF6114 domain-containing protein [Streptomyces roseolus]|uniref:DUF6114 domain-containing protein n=1 Tax=Streptomyces roseolus TaxID=67358 RepID=UPI00167C2030|nr:DUF6114 domain-containing protein [Streptomyces roseolus]
MAAPPAAGPVLGSAGAGIVPGRRAGPAALATGGLRCLVPLTTLGHGLPVLGGPRRRRRYGTVGVLASPASWVAPDLGGLLLGTAPGTAGGALAPGRSGVAEERPDLRGGVGPGGAPTAGPQVGGPAWRGAGGAGGVIFAAPGARDLPGRLPDGTVTAPGGVTRRTRLRAGGPR